MIIKYPKGKELVQKFLLPMFFAFTGVCLYLFFFFFGGPRHIGTLVFLIGVIIYLKRRKEIKKLSKEIRSETNLKLELIFFLLLGLFLLLIFFLLLYLHVYYDLSDIVMKLIF